MASLEQHLSYSLAGDNGVYYAAGVTGLFRILHIPHCH